MIFNLNEGDCSAPATGLFDVCIIGAGAAGITLTSKLAQAGLRVALMEAGDHFVTSESQMLYEGQVVGDHYFNLLSCRQRFLGGTTNHWSGWCRPFEEIDFARGYLGKEYEWPINHNALVKFQAEACNILEVSEQFEFEAEHSSHIRPINFQFSPPVRFREKYGSLLRYAPNISLFLNANLEDIHGTTRKIQRASFVGYKKQRLSIHAKRFVFAMGGIENSRFLLWFREKHNALFFEENMPIGKYWMEHPHFVLGDVVANNEIFEHRFYSIQPEYQKELGILGCGLRLEKYDPPILKSVLRDMLCVAPKLGAELLDLANRRLICGAFLRAAWEQAPNIKNAVSLSDQKDALGIPTVELNWRKTQFDHNTVLESAKFFGNWLLDNNAGRIRLDQWVLSSGPYPTDDELAGYHHMGGTRMAKSPKYGVVDENCQVFGSENLFIAGSSIFTTSGHNNPTLPIVQFALRLAQFIVNNPA